MQKRTFVLGVWSTFALCGIGQAQSDVTDNGGVITAEFDNPNVNENFPKVIDNNTATKYFIGGHTVAWVQYESASPAVVVRYTLTSGNDAPARDPRQWNLQGSNDGATWTTLDTQTDQGFTARGQTNTYTFANTAAYTHYRLNITASSGSASLQFAEWELWTAAPPPSPVTVFDQPGFGGAAAGFTAGFFDRASLQARGVADDSISSLRVATGFLVVLFEHDHFRGAFLLRIADDPDLKDDGWNDRASSMIVIGARPLIRPPTDLGAAAVSPNRIDLSWRDNSVNERLFRIERSTDGRVFTSVATVPADTRAFSDTGLEPATSHHYRVRAENRGATSAFSNVAVATTPRSPVNAPTALRATAISSSRIDLGWRDNSNSETGFQIERSVGGSPFAVLATLDANVTSHSETELAPDTTFSYRVRAIAAAGNSGASNTSQATTLLPGTVDITDLGGVIDARLTGSGAESIDRFIDNSLDTKFFVPSPTNTITFEALRSHLVTRYDITSGNDAPDRDPRAWTFQGSSDGVTWTTLDSRSGETFPGRVLTRTFRFASSAAYIAFRLDITANNGSPDLQATEWSLYGAPGSGSPPAAPSHPTATSPSPSRIDLAWMDNAGDETGFQVERLREDGSGYVRLATLGPDTTSYADTALAEAVTYHYRVRARNASGFSVYVNASGTTQTGDPTLIDITDLPGTVTDRFNTEGPEGTTKSIDNTPFTKYLAADTDSTWIQFEAESPSVVTKYTVTSANDAPGRDPRSWTLQASHDGLAWTILAAQPNEMFINRFQKKSFVFSNAVAYRFYRLDIASNFDNAEAHTQLAEWQIFGTGTGTSPDPAAPSDLQATAPSGNQIVVTWSDNTLYESSYELERSTDGGATWGLLRSLPIGTTRYFDLGLTGETSYHYRVRARNAAADSDFSNVASATTTTADLPETWQEHWFEHVQPLNRAFYNDEVAVYFDPDMDPSLTWMNDVTTQLWQYTKSVYGDFSDPRLASVHHQGRYFGGHPSTVFDGSHDFRNVIDIGLLWSPLPEDPGQLDIVAHEIGHIVEGSSLGVHNSPAFPLWRDSKWCEIFQYDAYVGVGMTAAAERWFSLMNAQVDDFPRPGSRWFRDWFYPIWNKHGRSAALAGFFRLLSQHFPQFNGDFQRDLNWGEFVHFWSGAAGTNLKPLATSAFGWSPVYEQQFLQAQRDFPGVTYPGLTDAASDPAPRDP